MSLSTNNKIAERIYSFSKAKWLSMLIAVQGIEHAGCRVETRILLRQVLLATGMRIILIARLVLLSLRILVIVI